MSTQSEIDEVYREIGRLDDKLRKQVSELGTAQRKAKEANDHLRDEEAEVRELESEKSKLENKLRKLQSNLQKEIAEEQRKDQARMKNSTANDNNPKKPKKASGFW
jgi:chromosome segregation ATPase